jgi:hypothetical protein
MTLLADVTYFVFFKVTMGHWMHRPMVLASSPGGHTIRRWETLVQVGYKSSVLDEGS